MALVHFPPFWVSVSVSLLFFGGFALLFSLKYKRHKKQSSTKIELSKLQLSFSQPAPAHKRIVFASKGPIEGEFLLEGLRGGILP